MTFNFPDADILLQKRRQILRFLLEEQLLQGEGLGHEERVSAHLSKGVGHFASTKEVLDVHDAQGLIEIPVAEGESGMAGLAGGILRECKLPIYH